MEEFTASLSKCSSLVEEALAHAPTDSSRRWRGGRQEPERVLPQGP